MPIKCHNRVLLLLACVAIAAVALPFVNVAPNRLVSGEGRTLWQVWPFTPLLMVAALGAVVALSLWQGRTAQWLTLFLCEGFFIVLFWCAGLAATHMASAESPLARTSVGSGLWLWLALCLLACSDAIRRLIPTSAWRWVLNAQIWCIPLLLLFSGELNNLSLLKEYANRQEVFDDALAQHLTILFGTLFPALLLGVPLGMGAVIRRHALRNALLPVITLLGLSVPGLIGGSVIIESIFALPGLGQLFYGAVMDILNSQLEARHLRPEDRLHLYLSAEGTLMVEGNDNDAALLCDIITRRPDLQKSFKEMARVAMLSHGVELAAQMHNDIADQADDAANPMTACPQFAGKRIEHTTFTGPRFTNNEERLTKCCVQNGLLAFALDRNNFTVCRLDTFVTLKHGFLLHGLHQEAALVI